MGKGLLLAPAVFVWPNNVRLLFDPVARAPAPPTSALEFALGRQRARVLLAVSLPSTPATWPGGSE